MASGRLAKIRILLIALTLLRVCSARGAEIEEQETLGLMGGEETLVSTSRIPRPVSRIAENVTVVGSDQIALLNAHTLAEVLDTVPGFHLEQTRTPGSWTDISLQGAQSAHLQLLVDGVPQGNLLQGQIDPGFIPVQQIERIEIIKGAASTAWGQALGGVINVITKSPDPARAAGGSLTASAGERTTTDLRAEVTGGSGRFGYYLSGGNLHSDGLLANNGVDRNNAYGKFSYRLPAGGTLTGGADYRRAQRGLNETASTHDAAQAEGQYSFLSLGYPLAGTLRLDLDASERHRDDIAFWNDLVDGSVVPFRQFHLRENTRGGSARLSWGDTQASLVGGVEYQHAETRQWESLFPTSPFTIDRSWDRWGTFANGSFSLGPLTILPGIRFDHTGMTSDALSYTLGATYELTEKTVLRGYYAKGYSLPNAIWNNGPQGVRTWQAGLESAELPWLWLKGTFFHNSLSNVEVTDFDSGPPTTLRSQVKQGVEVEGRTLPLYHLSLSGGYTYIDARDRESGVRLHDVPQHGAKLALHYDHRSAGLAGVLTANYVRWNSDPGNAPQDGGVVWDLSLTQRVLPGRELSPELFFSLHNIFDTAQYRIDLYRNTGRWLEGGARVRF